MSLDRPSSDQPIDARPATRIIGHHFQTPLVVEVRTPLRGESTRDRVALSLLLCPEPSKSRRGRPS
jgi:hypothetical protein